VVDLIIRPSTLNPNPRKRWALQLRYATMAETDYSTLCHLSDGMAKDVLDAGAAYMLFNPPINWAEEMEQLEPEQMTQGELVAKVHALEQQLVSRVATDGPETILASAMKYHGVVVSLPSPARHHNIIHMLAAAYPRDWPIQGEQGFVTNTLRFVDRTEARKIAEEANQLIPRDDSGAVAPGDRLFSEDLW
jgi:hypothetical protein